MSAARKTATRAVTKRATLADVAAMAGVVPMTASRALNRSGYVSAEVLERVQAAARTLAYRPNVLARQLRGTKLKAVGIMLPDVANPFSAELLKGVMPVLRAAGYTGFIVTAERGEDEERLAMQSLVDHRIDGMVVATRGTQMGDAALKQMAAQGVCVVTIGRPVNVAGVDCVTADHFKGAFDVVQHLVRLGHKRIGFIGASGEAARGLRRYEGYRAALEQAGIAFNEAWAVGSAAGPAFATEEDGHTGMLALMKLKKPPTAVFARNDFAAIGALHASHELRLQVPKNVAVAGFDDIPLARYQTPPLTTVAQPIVEQGKIAAQMLLERIEGTAKKQRRMVEMDCQLVVRESTVVRK